LDFIAHLIQAAYGFAGVIVGIISAAFWMGRQTQKVSSHERRIVKLEKEYLTTEKCHDCKINLEDRLDNYQEEAVRVAEEIKQEAIRTAQEVRSEALKTAKTLEALTKERMDHIAEGLKGNAEMLKELVKDSKETKEHMGKMDKRQIQVIAHLKLKPID
jgi:phosphopantetheine adenylyltransferase